MDINLTQQDAQRIIELLNCTDYNITDIYETSFRAIRINEYMISEINIMIALHPRYLDVHNCYKYTTICTHVLKRFK